MFTREATDGTSVGHAREQPAARSPLRLALTGLTAASLEWYDFFLYGTAAALVFPSVFFPAQLPPLVAQLASFSTFAVGFVARPVGALLFGHIGDRAGRKPALLAALLTMGIATTFIGCLPPFRSAGLWSPIALVLLRFAQGLAVGGQWGGAVLLATESAPLERRGLYGSLAQAGVPVGVVLANLVFLLASVLTSTSAFMAYAWRIPFIASIAIVGLAILAQSRLPDTAAFRELEQAQRPRHSPVLEALRLHPRAIALSAGTFLANNLTFYILLTYVVAYGTSTVGLQLPRSTLLTAVLLANIVLLPVLFLAGALCDRFGRRRISMLGSALQGAWAFALFPLLETRSTVAIGLALLVGFAAQGVAYAPIAALFAEQFETRVRYSACSLAYQSAAIFGGGLAPIVATALYGQYHSNLPISIYIAAACAVSVLSAYRLRETLPAHASVA